MDRRGSGGYRGAGRMQGYRGEERTQGYGGEERTGGYRGRGRARGYGGGNGGGSSHFRTTNSFEISTDRTTFHFPRWHEIDRNLPVLHNFSSSIKCIGGYSEDEEKNFSNDKSYLSFLNMKYFPDPQSSKEKKVNFNLTIGEDEAQQYSGTPLGAFHNFLSWILSNEEKYIKEMDIDEKPTGNSGKFVFLKNALSRILSSFNSNQEHSFYAMCSDGIIYMLKDIRKPAIKYTNSDRFGIWAHKFEQLMTTSHHTADGIISNWDYRCVLSSQLGDHKLLYSGAIDCVNPDKYDEAMEDCSALVYLKSAYDNPRNVTTQSLQRYKMFDWCQELILTGAPDVIVGFRDEEGQMDSIKLYEKEDLVKEGKDHWDFFSAFTFLEKFLSFVKQRTESKPGTLFHFQKPERSLYFTSSEDQMIPNFIPDWFLESFRAE